MITAKTMKITAEKDRWVPDSGSTPMSVSQSGKPVTVRGASMISAIPRNSVRVPMVTAIDGSPIRAIRKPLSAPPSSADGERGDDRQPDPAAHRDQLPHRRLRTGRAWRRPTGRSRR